MFKGFNLHNPYFYLPIFLLFVIYFLLRAVFVNPFCDEIETFFDYVETGNVWEEIPNFSSANNHLLVTFIARFFYNIAGNNMFLFRLISLVGFVVYFFVSLKLIRDTVKSRLNVIVFVGLLSIAWINDFFSYARGYAIAISLFLACVYLLVKWKNELKFKWMPFILLFAWLSVFANLAFLNSAFVLLGCILLVLLVNMKKLTKTSILIHLSLLALFVITLIPLIKYSFELKEAGALWWGKKSGWWESTVEYLIELTFFKVHDGLFYVLLIVLTLMILSALYEIKKGGLSNFIQSSKGIITLLFFGHIVLTEVLVVFFGVNYPSDRVAIIFVVLFFLVLSFLLDSAKKVNFLMLLFLFFPITFVYQLNLSTSSYMGHTRVHPKSFEAIMQQLNNSKSFEMDGLNYRNYVYEMRNQEHVLIANVENYESDPILCFSKYISDINDDWKPTKFHTLVFEDGTSNARLYKLNLKFNKAEVFDTTIAKMEGSADFYTLLHEKLVENVAPSKRFQVAIDGSVFFEERPMQFNLVYTLKDDDTDNKVYSSINLVNYCELDKWLNFTWESPIYTSDNSSDNFMCYFWNLEFKKVKLKDFNIKIYELKESK